MKRFAILAFVAVALFGCDASSDVSRLIPVTPAWGVGSDEPEMTRSVPPSTREPQKWALLIGIDEYASDEVTDLRGTVNDVKLVETVLTTRFGFPQDHVQVLINSEATHGGIVQAVRNHLIANAKADDIVVLHYSGHGSQMRDISGDEIDGWDETLVPHDSRTPNVFDITDDELNGLLDELARQCRNITLILDSCHSGTGMRGAPARGVARDERPPPSPASYARSVGESDSTGVFLRDAGYVLLSGARSDQLAYEHYSDGFTYGAFTYHLSSALMNADGAVTYRDVMDRVRTDVTRFYVRQEPQIEGAQLDYHVFTDSSSAADAPYFLADGDSDGRVTLRAGDVHGITRSSVYDVFEPGTRRFAETTPMAQIEVEKVEAFLSQARLLRGDAVPLAARAVERRRAAPNRQLYLAYDDIENSAVLRAVKSELDGLSHLRTVPSDSGYNILLRESDDRVLIEGADTSLVTAAIPADAPDVADRVADEVYHWTRWFNVLSIENPNPRLDVTFEISATDPVEGSRNPFEQPDQIEGIVYEGEEFACTVTNNSAQDLFVTLLDLTSNGTVASIYPYPHGASELLPAGRSVTRRFTASVDGPGESSKDILKLFVTSSPVDLSALAQTTRRDAGQSDVSDEPLEQYLSQAMLGTSRSVQPIELGSWMTAQRAILILRNRPSG